MWTDTTFYNPKKFSFWLKLIILLCFQFVTLITADIWIQYWYWLSMKLFWWEPSPPAKKIFRLGRWYDWGHSITLARNAIFQSVTLIKDNMSAKWVWWGSGVQLDCAEMHTTLPCTFAIHPCENINFCYISYFFWYFVFASLHILHIGQPSSWK